MVKKQESKVGLKFVFEDGENLVNLDRVTSIRGDVKKVLLHLDEFDDGTHLLIINEKLWDASKRRLTRIEVVREKL